MGFFSKITGADARRSKYRKAAELAFKLVQDHSKSIEMNLEEVMSSGNGTIPHLRLESFVFGFISVLVEDTHVYELIGYKSISISKVVVDFLKSKGYQSHDFNWMIGEYAKKLSQNNDKDSLGKFKIIVRECSFVSGGMKVAASMRINNDVSTLSNLSIFLRTMKEKDGAYDMEGFSNYETVKD